MTGATRPSSPPEGDEDLSLLTRYARMLAERPAWRWHGRVVEAVGQVIKSEGPFCTVGECCEILDDSGARHAGEVIGFRGNQVLAMPIDRLGAIHYGNAVAALGTRPQIGVGYALRGRVLNAMGKAIDGLPTPRLTESWVLDRPILSAMDRLPIEEPIGTGVRAIDGLLTTGCGQRVGIFGGSGVGKSTLIGVMTRNTSADVTVVGLVGERGREVREFLQDSLGEEGRKKSVVVVSTSDESPLLRIRAALSATAIAEYYARRGNRVLLVIDSLTRYAMAEREIGLAAGEPPTAKGYTPSVFAKLARLVERAGRTQRGSVTAFYTVLMEGDDQQDPIVDAVRSLLDGHIVLSRALASEGRYPPIAVLDSVSRLINAIATPEHLEKARQMRRLLATHAQSEDLVRIGAYRSGTDPELDLALRVMPQIRAFLEQRSDEAVTFTDSVAAMLSLPLGASA